MSWYWKIILISSSLVGYAIWLSWLQGNTGFPDPDAFYHIGMAEHLWEFGFTDQFTGLQPTTLGEHFVDQHFLLHAILSPFVLGLGPVLGTKLYTVLVLLAVLAVWSWVFYRLAKQSWWIGALALALTNPWLFRMHLVKATPLVLILLALAWLVMQGKKPFWLLAVISFIYVWTHGGFILMVCLVLVWSMSTSIMARQFSWQHYQSVGWTLLGIVCAVLLQPVFPANLFFYWEQLVQIGAVNYQAIIGVGGEWYPYPPGALVFGHWLLLAVCLAAIITQVGLRKPLTVPQTMAVLSTIIFLLLTFKSKRYVEYLAPWLAVVVVLYAQTWWQWRSQSWRAAWLIPLAAVIMVMVPIILTDQTSLQADLRDGKTIQYLSGTAHYLNTLPAGQLIAPSDWDDFPSLWRGAPQQQYLIGLDPTFLYLANPARYEAWKQLTLGQAITAEDILLIDADYYVVLKDHQSMYQQLVQQQASVVYEDDEAWVLKKQ